MITKLKSLITKNNSKNIIIFLLALFVTISFSISLDMVTNDDIKEITENTGYITKILLKINYSIDKDIFTSALLFICLNLLFRHTLFKNKKEVNSESKKEKNEINSKNANAEESINKKGNKNIDKNKKGKVCKIVLALIFTFFMIFGYSYYKVNSWSLIFGNTFQLFKAIIKAIGYYIIFKALINYLFDNILNNITIKEKTNKIYNFIFVKHSFILPLIIILICWLPYIVSLYPGVLFQDSSNQIRQYFGYDVPEDSSTNSSNLIDENVKITNHHPITHTVILGLCMQFGKLVHNDNLGLFLYTFMQVMLLTSTFAYIINFTKKLKIPNWIRTVALLIFALLPIIPFYAMEVTKDVPFTCFVIYYVILLYDLINNANLKKLELKNILKIMAVSMLVILFRNNGIYVVILSLPFVAIFDKMNRKKIITTTVIIFVITQLFNSVLLPALKITSSSIREALCVPFQQTARYVKEYDDELKEEERQAIDKVLDYSTLAERYDPTNADKVKNKYKKDATTEDLVNYLKVWFSQLFKHPTVYLEATFNNVYGYFYPESNPRQFTTDFIIDEHSSINNTGNFDYHYIKEFRGARENIKIITDISKKIPVISWINNIAFNVWTIIIIIGYLIYTKKYRYIVYIMPYISIILVCIASPINAYFRYAIPYVFAMLLIIAIFVDIVANKKRAAKS